MFLLQLISYFCRPVRPFIERLSKRQEGLKSKLKYLCLFLFLPLLVSPQTDTVSQSTLDFFISDLNQGQGGLKYDGNGRILTDVDQTQDLTFSKKLENKYLHLFPEELPESSSYYLFLNGLNKEQKSNLVKNFYTSEAFIDSSLVRAELPSEIKFLPAALSAMNQRAIGEDKRAGIWQLTHFQAFFNGLQLTRLVDERFDNGPSTLAAVAELKKMKENFGSDELAVLAFLCGPTSVRNASQAADETPAPGEILSRLPAKVSEKMALWQAMAVFLPENKWERELTIPATDTVIITDKVHFQQISTSLNIPVKLLQNYNPQYPYLIVPGDEKPQNLYLPNGKKEEFNLLKDSVSRLFDPTLFDVVAQKIEYAPAPNRQYLGEKVKDLEIEGKTKIKYTIQSGDVLGFIAEDYDVRVEDLKYWNNIYNERKIQAGQKLDIFVDDADADYYRNLHPEPLTKTGAKNPAAAKSYPIPENARKIEHEVKSGESPYVIAQKYKGVSPDAILYWNGISDARKIQIGQKLTIYVTE